MKPVDIINYQDQLASHGSESARSVLETNPGPPEHLTGLKSTEAFDQMWDQFNKKEFAASYRLTLPPRAIIYDAPDQREVFALQVSLDKSNISRGQEDRSITIKWYAPGVENPEDAVPDETISRQELVDADTEEDRAALSVRLNQLLWSLNAYQTGITLRRDTPVAMQVDFIKAQRVWTN